MVLPNPESKPDDDSIEPLVAAANEAFNRNDPMWCAQLAIHLDKRRHGLAYLWIARSVRILLERMEPPLKQDLLADLDRLEVLRTRPLPSKDLVDTAELIWYRYGGDPCHKAVSKLFGALDSVLHPAQCYVLSITAPLNNLLYGGASGWHSDAVVFRDLAIDELRRLEQSATGSEEQPSE